MGETKGTERFGKAVILVDALIFLGLGAVMLYDPLPLLAGVGVGAVGPESVAGSTELRAMYGGLELGLGLFCLLGLLRPAYLAPALAMSTLALAGLGAGRLAGILLAAPTPLLLKLLLSEVVSAGLNAVAWWRIERRG